MEPAELHAAMKQLRLSYAETAKLLCVSIETVRAWRYGKNPIPPYMARIVRLLAWGRLPITRWNWAADARKVARYRSLKSQREMDDKENAEIERGAAADPDNPIWVDDEGPIRWVP